jgi:hypothetical protein
MGAERFRGSEVLGSAFRNFGLKGSGTLGSAPPLAVEVTSLIEKETLSLVIFI